MELWKIILLVSAVVVTIGGLGFYIWVRFWIKKYRKKMNDGNSILDSKINRPNGGDVDMNLKESLGSKFDIFDLETILNFLYRNSFRKIKVIGDDSIFITLSIWKQLQFIKITNPEFDNELIEKVKNDFPDYREFINEENSNDYDALIINKSKFDYNKTYDTFIKDVKEKGTLIIVENSNNLIKEDFESLQKHLNYLKEHHETIKVKNKITFITKNFN
ncbi:hypothetical protein EI74_0664 [Mycoplasma testudineum]|uniref:Methyltransferase n=1 Tax=Mycoplasma testudineum TaxID=244584 RepID=A0A4R6IEQ4_9MOLU|nr:hypothetical protein [Mycoplasma testudineum]OYD26564.1 hypothetical protein CG473_02910 [Mycoplasma testudineum]TDO19395.1 hypothetical protein EI74_0664 [Mycoplasma testudineum]